MRRLINSRYVFSSSQSASISSFQDSLHGQFQRASFKQLRLQMMFFYMAQIAILQSFIDQNRDRTNDFWGAKHIQLKKCC